MSSAWLDEFGSPGSAYRGKPFWAWNGRLEPEELRRQIRIMQRMGMGGFIIFTGNGLETAYLAGTPIALAPLSEARTVDGARGPLADFIIESWNRGEPIGDAITVDVTAQLSNFTEYVTISVS